MTLKQKALGTMIAGITAIAISTFLIFHYLKAMDTQWGRYSAEVVSRETLLSEIKSNFGYGGIIHNFKNYVLRGDQKFEKRITGNQDGILQALQNYRALNINTDEADALGKIEGVMRTYFNNVSIVGSMWAEGKTPKEIDGVVKISDKPAFEGFAVLKERFDALEEQTMLDYAAATTGLHTILLIVVPVLSACLLIATLTFRAAAKEVGSLATASSHIAKDITYRASLPVSRNDELGILSSALLHMVDNLREKITEATNQSEESKKHFEESQKAHKESEQREEALARQNAMIRETATKAVSAVETVAAATTDLEDMVSLIAEGAEQQKERVSSTTLAMEEMNATVIEVAHNASDASDQAGQSSEYAQEGAGMVRKLQEAVETVGQETSSFTNTMGDLAEQADAIGGVISTINDIADQTNLLALNAAIEAARAGDAGRGFAVVADEVRKLAEKTMQATKEVEAQIKGIQGGVVGVAEGARRMNERVGTTAEDSNRALESLSRITSTAEQTSDSVRSIATASEQQSATSEEINNSIADVHDIANDTAERVDSFTLALKEMAEQANSLKLLMTDLENATST